MANIKLLTVKQVEHLPEGLHSDGGNLYLRVRESGSRAWLFRYKRKIIVDGRTVYKPFDLGLGSTINRTLAQARDIAAKMRTAIADGEDPASVLKVKPDIAEKTFADYARECIESMRSGWRNGKHAAQWTATLELYAFPVIGDKLPKDVSIADVKAILLPIWAAKTETASRVRQRIEAVLDYAIVHDDDQNRGNPARWKGVLDKILPAPRKVTKRIHHAAAPYSDAPTIMSALRDKDCLSAYCLRFTILTAARSGEARGALWSEIDLKNRTWVVPSSRMKAEREHKVPLSDEAVGILVKMKERRAKGAERVFDGERGGLLSDVAVNKTLHRIAPDVTVHGFRSSFRMWGAETTSFPSAVLEAALAHVNQNQVEAAYQRSDLFDRRVELMTAWGNYCASKGNVIKLRKNNTVS